MSGRIVVDELQKWPTKIRCFQAGSCHLMAEADEHGQHDLEAMHKFAASIGIKRAWFQPSSGTALAHYDLTPSKREMALAFGAVFVPWREQAKARIAARDKVAPVRRVKVMSDEEDRERVARADEAS